jgi:positive regulator of sigma E activity
VVVPLVVIAIVWIAKRAKKEQKPADAYRSMITWWLLPYLASLVFVLSGKILPYYRFMNSTASIMPLAALGIFVVGVWLMKKTNRNGLADTLAASVLVHKARPGDTTRAVSGGLV